MNCKKISEIEVASYFFFFLQSTRSTIYNIHKFVFVNNTVWTSGVLLLSLFFFRVCSELSREYVKNSLLTQLSQFFAVQADCIVHFVVLTPLSCSLITLRMQMGSPSSCKFVFNQVNNNVRLLINLLQFMAVTVLHSRNCMPAQMERLRRKMMISCFFEEGC